MVTELPHPKLGSVKLVTGAVTLSDTPVEITSAAPGHGEHNEEVLGRLRDSGEAAQ
jgi:crotonobetainyl-CoA:carnitine CoA-transferase CaiB-like acyl-CoA transferase